MGSALEISRALHMTTANVRHHFAVLKNQGLIEEIGSRPSKNRGRPAKLFGLPADVLDNNINALATALLKSFLAGGNLESQFTILINNLFPDPPTDGGKNASLQQLNQIVQRLNHANYQARWEASPTGPRFILGHCPYAAILPNHPELCQMDRIFLSQQLNSSVKQIAKLERNPQGTSYCVFSIQQSLGE
ncbi:MAG: ArsR family transcriptional regulator [Chloroflexi bacterium]|nr:ArsR family transcriptional regulator [Chloroflexota bacterium]